MCEHSLTPVLASLTTERRILLMSGEVLTREAVSFRDHQSLTIRLRAAWLEWLALPMLRGLAW